MTLAEYRIDLGYFGGPLDLLLYLVRRHELDVCDVSLARITSEFNQHLEVLELLDLDLIGDFIVVASTLLEIKSREVLPEQPDLVDADAVEDLGSNELIQRLMEYRRFKQAAIQLEQRASEWLERYPRLTDDRPERAGKSIPDRVRGVEIWDLVSALTRIVRIPEIAEQTTIRMDETPLSVHQDRIRRRLQLEKRAEFSSFFDGEKNQVRIVGIFQAILELIRHERYRAEQFVDWGEIWILAPSATEEEDESI
ncbi:MAG: segregation/condensation protein A [Fuerstiella sp.]|nr:segregation/condensation protein A [Fuerstiella sp.]